MTDKVHTQFFLHNFFTQEDDEAEELYDEIMDLANSELWEDLCDYIESCYVTMEGEGDLEVDIDWKHSGMSDKEWRRLTYR